MLFAKNFFSNAMSLPVAGLLLKNGCALIVGSDLYSSAPSKRHGKGGTHTTLGLSSKAG